MLYRYDGGFEGFLTCVFESYERREAPEDILPPAAAQTTLVPAREIEADREKALRVYASLKTKISREAQNLVATAFCCAAPDREIALWRFIRLGLAGGGRAVARLGDAVVSRVHALARAVVNEQHWMVEFLRFSEYEGGLAAVIEPKHFVLPMLEGHFTGRFPEEQFLIYDKIHRMALIYRPYESRLLPAAEIEPPAAGETEQFYRRLWRRYYDAAAIEQRINPRLRMGHMRKRFWGNITEMQGEAAHFPEYGERIALDKSPQERYADRRNHLAVKPPCGKAADGQAADGFTVRGEKFREEGIDDALY